MRVAILGAAGGLGTRLVHEALWSGLEVQALTRQPERLRLANDRLNVFRGHVEHGADLAGLVGGCPFVISAMSAHRPAEVVASVIKAVGNQRLERLVFVTTLSLDTRRGLARVFRRRSTDEVDGALDLLRASGLSWLVVFCSKLNNERGRLMAYDGRETANILPVGRAPLSRFIIGRLEEPGWECREVTVSGVLN